MATLTVTTLNDVVNAGDRAGREFSNADEMNDDGFGDIIIGAIRAAQRGGCLK